MAQPKQTSWRLLPIASGGPALPLLPGSELALIAAASHRNAAPLADVLAVDPALTLWALAQARNAAPIITTLEACAAWLVSDQGISALHAAAAIHPPESEQPARSQADRVAHWRRLVRDGVLIASLARVAAAESASGDEKRPRQAYLIGLIHRAAAWLAGSEAPLAPQAEFASPLPARWLSPWLAIQLGALPSEPAQTWQRVVAPQGQAVAQALAMANFSRDDVVAAQRAAAAAARPWRRWNLQGPLVIPSVLASIAVGEHCESSPRSNASSSPCPADSSAPLPADLEREKLEALAEFAAGAGHEINNPLAVISGRAQLMMRSEMSAERRRDAALIHAQAQRVHEMIADLMFFARPPQVQRQRFELGAALEELLAELATHPGADGVALALSAPAEPVEIVADRSQLLAAVRAICLNSLFALAGRGRLELQWSRSNDLPGVRLIVRDTGPGIRPEVRRHLFDPYYSGRESGRGLGVGLSKAWRIVTLHGGTIEVESQLGQGTSMVLLLPDNEAEP